MLLRNKTFVSVVIPARNEEKYLKKTLESLITQQQIDDYEIIVVDNNSNDKTAEIARSFGAKVIFHREKGVGAARHAGFSLAQGYIIATTDADSIVPSNWIARIVEHFNNDDSLVAVGGLALLYSGPLSAKIATRYFYYSFMLIDKLLSGSWSLCGNNMAVRNDKYKMIGGFRRDLVIGEDVDLAKRLATVGNVQLDKRLLVSTSGRRFRYGFISGIMTYVPSALMRLFFKKEMFIKFHDIRDEYSFPNRASFISILILLLIIIFLQRKKRVLF